MGVRVGAGRAAHISPPCSSLAPLVKGLLGAGGRGVGRGDWGPLSSPHATPPPKGTEPRAGGQGRGEHGPSRPPQPCHSLQAPPRKKKVRTEKEPDTIYWESFKRERKDLHPPPSSPKGAKETKEERH